MQGAKSKIQNTIPSTLFRQAELEGVATNKILYWRKRKKNVNNNKKKISSFLTLFFFSPYIKRIVQRPAVGTLVQKKQQQSAISSDRSFSSSVPVFRLFPFHTASLNYTFSPFSYTPQCKTNPKYLTSYIVYGDFFLFNFVLRTFLQPLYYLNITGTIKVK